MRVGGGQEDQLGACSAPAGTQLTESTNKGVSLTVRALSLGMPGHVFHPPLPLRD